MSLNNTKSTYTAIKLFQLYSFKNIFSSFIFDINIFVKNNTSILYTF